MRRTLSILSIWVLAMLAFVPIKSQAQGQAFSCDGTFYQIRQVGNGGSAFSAMYVVNRATASYTTSAYTFGGTNASGNLGTVMNALGYNPQDGYMYAVTYPADNGTPNATTGIHLFRIGQGGVQDLGRTNLPLAQYNSGTFDKTGRFYLTTRNSTDATYRNTLFRLNLANFATVLTAHDELGLVNSGGGAANDNFSDIGYNPSDNTIYTVALLGNISRIVVGTTTAVVTPVSTGSTSSEIFGSAFFDISGNMYAYSNGTVGTPNSAGFYSVNTQTGGATLISTIDAANNSDGASCINPDQRIDVVKQVVSVVPTGTARQYNVRFAIRVKNTGTSTATNIQVSDFLRGNATNTTFPTANTITLVANSGSVTNYGVNQTAAPTLAFNTAFNGQGTNTDLLSGNQQLTASQSALIDFTVTVTFPTNASVPTGASLNTAYASSISGMSSNQGHIQLSDGTILPPGNLLAEDNSTNSAGFPATPNGDNSSPTPVYLNAAILGNVFEDANYGGGLGRSQATSGGQGTVARVELYSALGTFIAATNASASGAYAFLNGTGGVPANGLIGGTSYQVRVVNNTVVSNRAGGVSGLFPVQTFISNGVTDNVSRVGGQAPAESDYGNITSGLLPTSIISATQEIQSITTVTLPNAGPRFGVDFGYSFDVVVNKNDAGQGSLRQFILNSNALGDENTLAQVYTSSGGVATLLTAAQETSIFMMPNGSAVAGQVAGLASQFTNGVATIALSSALNAVTGSATVIDGSTQTRSTGDSNPVVATAGAQSTGPEVVLNLNGSTGLTFSGADEQLLSMGVTGSATADGGVLVSSTASNLTLDNNTLYGNGTNVALLSGSTGTTVSNNVIRNSTAIGGLVVQSGSSNNTFTQNIFDSNAGLAIDLNNNGLTLNDNGDVDTGANGLLNFPVITSATLTGANLTVRGYARAGSLIELYSVGSAADATGFGEGQLYLGTVTEGGAAGNGNLAADTDTRTGLSYSGLINGLNQGSDNSANGFTFVIPIASLAGGTIAARTILSSTATLANNTSEFSGNVTVRDLTVANDDQATTTPGVAITFAVTANDTPSADIAPATIDLDPNTAGIQTTLNLTGVGSFATGGSIPVGSVQFTPAAGFVGIADIPYTVQNTSGATSNQANLIVKVQNQYDLATTIATSATIVVAGNQITISGTTVNNSLTAANASQNVQLPVGLSGIITVSQNGSSPSNQTINSGNTTGTTGLYTFGTINLAAGATSNWSLTFTAPLSGPFTATAFVNPTATSSPFIGDINLANNTATSAVVNVTPKTDISTTITGPTLADPIEGNLIAYVVTTGNSTTSSPATGVVQTVQLPTSGVTGVYATNGGVYSALAGTVVFDGVSYTVAAGTVTFPPVNLAAGQVVNNTVAFLSDIPAVYTLANIIASVPTTNDPATGDNSASAIFVTVQPAGSARANLYTTVTGPTQVAAGATATYTVTQGNAGPNSASNARTTVHLPAGLTVGTLTVGGATGSQNANIITFGTDGTTYNVTTGLLTLPVIGTQASAATAQPYTIALTAPATSSAVTITAFVTSSTADDVPSDNISTVQTEILPSADVAITLNNPGDAANVSAGQTINYTVQTQNNSNYAARNVQQTVAIPAGLSVATLKLNGATGTLNTGVITFGSGATAITYDVAKGVVTLPLISSLTKGVLVNNTISFAAPGNSTATGLRGLASVTSATPDPSLGNNTATARNGINTVEDLTVSIAGPTQAATSNQLLYTVTTTNNGPSASGTQTTTVQLPVGLSNVEVRDNSGTVVTGAYAAATGIVTFATTTAVPTVGQSIQGTISFLAPDVNQVSLTATVAVTSPGTGNFELNTDNNAARISTLVSTPGSSAAIDLVAGFSAAPGANTTAGSTASYTATMLNNGPVAAINPVQYVSLPVGLSATALTLNGSTGNLNAGVITFTGGATYTVSTGLLRVAPATALASGSTLSSIIAFPLPLTSNTLTVTTDATSDNPDSNPTNNLARTTTTTSASADVVLGVSGPANAVAGSTVSYEVVATNAGPATATGTTVTFTLPAGVSSYTVNGGTATSGSGTITLQPSGNTLVAGSNLSYIVSFTAPSATFTVSSVATTTSTDPNAANNNAANLNGSVKTVVNTAPVANDVVNILQSPQSNTAAAQLISSLSGTDADNNPLTYRVTSVPDGSQGILSYNIGGTTYATLTAGQGLSATQAATLKFDPAATFTGSVFFTYTAIDNGNNTTADALTSAPARYTIQVAPDVASKYALTQTKGGGANRYTNGDVLAYGIDANAARYNGSGTVYNTTTGVQSGSTSNGISIGRISAADSTALATYGVGFNRSTGLFTVTDILKLPRPGMTLPGVTVTTRDLNGGINTNIVALKLGVNPLPVELKEFTAVAVKNMDAQLNWSTASEKANDHFDVERSLTGTDFVKIGQVQGQGSVSTTTAYALTDAGIGAKATGLVYYRLKQVDTDGTSSYSPVRTVSFTATALTPSISLWPNPATAATKLDLSQLPVGRYEVSILDATGRTVLHTSLEAGLAHALDLNTIASGTYVVLVRGQHGGQPLTLTKRLLKE